MPQLQEAYKRIAKLETEREALVETVRSLQKHITCSHFDLERPLKQHGPSTICIHCYEELRAEYARVALVAGSINSIVLSGMRHGKNCPFCDGLKAHHESCYLRFGSGQLLLDEYCAIEQHRDMLLAEKSRMNGHGIVRQDVVRVALKSRYHTPHNGR